MQIYPHAGWVEHDPEDIFRSVLSCIQKLPLEDVDRVAGIAVTNQRETIVAWDRSTGKPFHNALVWLDTRTHDMVKKEADTTQLGVNKYRHITGLPLSTYFSAMKIKWLIENVPLISSALESNSCCFGTIDSYITHRLTSGRVHVTDCTNASRYNLMDLRTLDWSPEICRELGIPLTSLPKIVSSAEQVGVVDESVVPVLADVPITSLIGDQHAALLGHGCTEPSLCKITYGTGCFLLRNTGTEPVPSASGALLTTLAFKLGKDAPTLYALEGSVAAAGRSVQWAMDNLRIGDNLFEFNEIASSVTDTCGVTFVPAFSGLFAPYWRNDARAVIVGMSLRASYRHLARAILEATAMQCAEVMKLIERDGGSADSASIVTDGGMTKSDLLMQIQADVLGAPVKRARMTEATAFGAAYAAGHSIGFWEGAPVQDIKALQEGYDSFVPTMSAEERGRTFARWEDAVKRSFDLSKFSE